MDKISQYHQSNNSKLEDSLVMTSKTNSYVPLSALCAESTLERIRFKLENTPDTEGGTVLGIIKPIWRKAMESELRIAWLNEMIRRKLVIRDLEIFGKSMNEKLRTEGAKVNEMEREALLDLMRLKSKDEKRYYREIKEVKEGLRDWIRKKFKRRKYNNLMEKMKNELENRKNKIKTKYIQKTKHLEEERLEEIKKKLEIVPPGLEYLRECKIFHRDKMEKMEVEEAAVTSIGKIKLDKDEVSILKLNPKFAIMKKLVKIETEQDVELCAAKLRYEISRIEKLRGENEKEESEFGYIQERKRRKLNEELTEKENKKKL